MKESVSDGLEKKRANNNCVCVSVWRNKFDSSAVFLFGHTNDPERMWPKRWKYLNHRCYIWPFQHDVPLIRIGECCIGPCFIHSRFDLIRVKFVAFEPEKTDIQCDEEMPMQVNNHTVSHCELYTATIRLLIIKKADSRPRTSDIMSASDCRKEPMHH